jgi:hypothetical protein
VVVVEEMIYSESKKRRQIAKQQQKDAEGFMKDHCEPDNILKLRKKHSAGTEFQEDHIR